MGHYDDCREADNKEKGEKRSKEVREELIDLIYALNDNDREFLIDVVKNLKDLKSMIKFLKKMTK